MVSKMTKNDSSVPKAIWCTNKTTTNRLSVTTGVPNVKCAKVNQMYQNSLGMMPSVLNIDHIPSVPKCNWCTKRNDSTNVSKMTKNDHSVPAFGSVHFYIGF